MRTVRFQNATTRHLLDRLFSRPLECLCMGVCIFIHAPLLASRHAAPPSSCHSPNPLTTHATHFPLCRCSHNLSCEKLLKLQDLHFYFHVSGKSTQRRWWWWWWGCTVKITQSHITISRIFNWPSGLGNF